MVLYFPHIITHVFRDTGSRRIDHIPASLVTSSGRRRDYAPQPYFKNPSYYPRDKEHPPRATSPPPLVPRLEPLPGGRLPLVQRRSSPAPYESSAPHRRSPAPPLKKRRYIVEEISHVPRRYWLHIFLGLVPIHNNFLLPISKTTGCPFLGVKRRQNGAFLEEEKFKETEQLCLSSSTSWKTT